MKGLEVQPAYPLRDVLKGYYTIAIKKGTLTITILLQLCPLKRHSKLVTAFYFDTILILGDPEYIPLIRSIKTPVYCNYRCLIISHGMVWLKVSCIEGADRAHHSKHYGMKV